MATTDAGVAGHDVDFLVELLDIEPIEVNIFRGVSPSWTKMQRVFGGQVAAQSLMAAGRTVDKGRVHSLHSYFLRPGDPSIPILYEVDRIRDGKSFTTRRVVAIQYGRAIFHLSASFHVEEVGAEHQATMPDAPDPEAVPTLAERLAPHAEEIGEYLDRPHPIDQRFVGDLPWLLEGRTSTEARQQLWFRSDGPLGDDPLLHACVITYASDMSLFDSMLIPHRIRWDDRGFQGASLDHCIWFHRFFRADEWLFYDQESPAAAGARGFVRAQLFTASGELVASLVQEGLMRTRPPRQDT